MKLDIAISDKVGKHISRLRFGQDLLNAVLIWGHFDFESHDYYNLAFVDDEQINKEWPYFNVGEFKIYVDRKDIVEKINGKNLVIQDGELSFD